jgi:hypothetical protein
MQLRLTFVPCRDGLAWKGTNMFGGFMVCPTNKSGLRYESHREFDVLESNRHAWLCKTRKEGSRLAKNILALVCRCKRHVSYSRWGEMQLMIASCSSVICHGLSMFLDSRAY